MTLRAAPELLGEGRPTLVANDDIEAAPPVEEGRLLYVCLQRVAGHFGRPNSDVALLAGLPVIGHALDAEMFIRAAQRIGLQAEWASAPASELTTAEAPALAWRVDGAPVLIESVAAGAAFTIFDPAQGSVLAIGLEEAREILRPEIIVLSPDLTRAQGQEAVEPTHWFWGIARVFWRSYAYIIGASVFINLLAIATPLFAMNVYDRVLPNKAIPTLWVLAIGLGLALLFDFILRMARALTIDYVGRRIDLRASSLLMERVLNAKLSKGGASTGLMTQRLHDYEFVREFLTSNTIVFFIDLMFSILFILIVVTLSPWLGIYPTLALIAMGVLGLVIQKLIRKELARATASSALRQSLLVEMVGSLEVLKSVRGEGHLLRKWDTITRDVSNVNERIKRYSSLAGNAAYFVQMSVTLVTVVIGAYLFDSGAISTGAIIAAVMLASRAVSPAGQIALTLARARQAASAFKSVDAIMNLPDERSDRRLVVSRPIGDARIEFSGASFAYSEEGRKVLDSLSLKIEPGERVAILGRIGVGKTTLGRLLARFHDLDSGQLLIDGIDIRQYHPHEVRRAITFVPQDADLFSGTLRDNLLVGKPGASDAELISACKLAGVDEFVARHPQGYDMPVGERGGLLSSGQKQMVGLARALLASGKVLFLDDPTSSMDMASEKLFVERLRTAVKPETTMIVTTHRNAVLRLVDRVVVIDKGRVVADGSAEAVLRRFGDGASPPPQRSAEAAPRAPTPQT